VVILDFDRSYKSLIGLCISCHLSWPWKWICPCGCNWPYIFQFKPLCVYIVLCLINLFLYNSLSEIIYYIYRTVKYKYFVLFFSLDMCALITVFFVSCFVNYHIYIYIYIYMYRPTDQPTNQPTMLNTIHIKYKIDMKEISVNDIAKWVRLWVETTKLGQYRRSGFESLWPHAVIYTCRWYMPGYENKCIWLWSIKGFCIYILSSSRKSLGLYVRCIYYCTRDFQLCQEVRQ